MLFANCLSGIGCFREVFMDMWTENDDLLSHNLFQIKRITHPQASQKRKYNVKGLRQFCFSHQPYSQKYDKRRCLRELAGARKALP